jgi:hypothetical protein
MPTEVLELLLLEKFPWTPTQLDEIPYKRLKTLLAVINVRDQVQSSQRKIQEELDGADRKVIGELQKSRGKKKKVVI